VGGAAVHDGRVDGVSNSDSDVDSDSDRELDRDVHNGSKRDPERDSERDSERDPERDPEREVQPAGVVFPMVAGRRSSTATGRAVLADAVRAVDPDLASAALNERDWRAGYLEPYRRMTALSVTRPGAAESISADGLASVQRRFVFRSGGRDVPLAEAMAAGPAAGAGPSPAPG